MQKLKIKELIGKPYKFNCFDLTGFDCYTLVYYIYLIHGIQLPKENISKYSIKVHQKLIKKNALKFEEIKFVDRQFLDVLVFETSESVDAHLGVLLDTKRFIHIDLDTTVKIEPLKDNIRTAKIKKVYRWNSFK